jgi:hypothetical protein
MVRHKKKKPKKKWKIRDIIYLSLAVVFSISIIYATFSYFTNPPQSPSEPPELFAAIIDPLSVNQPNQTFITEVGTLLEASGYTVDVFGWEAVTVNFYQALPIFGYDLIIIRTPQCLIEGQPEQYYGIPIFLITTEEYDQEEYTLMQQNEQVVAVQPFSNDKQYFALSPDFVYEVMQGQFEDTVIIIAGSYGLYDPSLAIDLFDKGALAIISWNGWIPPPYMDSATVLLLNNLFVERMNLEEAVEDTNNIFATELGALGYYPDSAGEIRYIY